MVKNRYETSLKIAQKFNNPEKVVIVSGENFPDALSASSLLGKDKSPVLLIGKNMNSSVENYLRSIKGTLERSYFYWWRKFIIKCNKSES